jgi:hypothetical protein
MDQGFSRKQLETIVNNRRRSGRTRLAADSARAVLEKAIRDVVPVDPMIESAVLGAVDDGFRLDCVIGGLKRGVLTICVLDERLLHHYRVKWELDLLDVIQHQCPRRGVSRVQFTKSSAPSDRSARPYQSK